MDQTMPPAQPVAEVGIPTTLPSSKVLFKEIVQTYKLLWKKLFLVALIPGIINVIFFYAGLALEEGYFSNLSEGIFWSIAMGTMAFSMITLFLSQIAVTSIISNAHKNILDTVTSSWKSSFSMFWSFIFIILLTSLIVFGGYLALIIPGIIFAFYLSFGLIVLVDEKEKGYNALIKSYLVMKGRFWEVFGSMFKIMIRALIFIIPFFILSIGSTFLGNYLDFGSFVPSSPVVQNSVMAGQVFQGHYTTAISQIINTIMSALFFPFMFIINYRIYAYLRFMKGTITPEETQKAGKTLKIFTGLGVVALVALVGFIWYGFSIGMFY